MICNLCPRRCGAVREEHRGEGHCRMPSLPVVARAALHHWEEPPVSGVNGSGTVFFSGCSLDCLFCQNDVISHQDYGKEITAERLGEICRGLVAQGAHNLNFVNPTHYAHVLYGLLKESFGVPAVWNTGGYERVETLRALEGKVDVYLPDLKYLTPALAGEYSGAEDYPSFATDAIREMVRQTGPYVMENNLITRGVIIRHLLLPGRLPEAKLVMDWVAETFPRGTVLFSLMGQYLPQAKAVGHPALGRRVRASELRAAVAYMEDLGLEGFTQDRAAAEEEYIPPFDLEGV